MSRAILGTYNLKHPITLLTKTSEGEVNEELLKPAGFEVVVNRPRAREMLVMDKYGDKQQLRAMIEMLASVSNLNVEEIDLLDAADVTALGNLLGSVFENGPTMGQTV